MAGASIGLIARKTGVSRATAARILGSDVSYARPTFAKRAEHIRQLAVQLGYRPNTAARAISTGRFNNIALVMGTHLERSNFTRELMRGIHDALGARGVHLTVAFLNDDQLEDESYLPKFLCERMVDGILLNYTHQIPEHMEAAIERARLPRIWVNVKRDDACVYPDDFDAARQAVQYLQQRGHQRIAFADFLHGPENDFSPHYSVLDRLAGYTAAMQAASLHPSRIETLRLLPGPAAVAAAAQSLHATDRPTGIVCQSPRDASVFEVAAARLGWTIPADLSLITFGGERQSGSVSDPTLLVEPREAMGHAAAEALLELIENPGRRSPARRVEYTLHSGDTVAARNLPPL